MFSSLRLKLEARLTTGYICFFLVHLTGCVPTISTVFVPVASSAQVLDARCPPEPGTVARFGQAGVFVSIRAYPDSRGNFGMQLAFEVPEGKTVELQDEKVYLHTGGEVLSFQVRGASGPWYLPMNGASIPQEEIGTRGWGTIYDPLPGTVGARLGVGSVDADRKLTHRQR